MTAVPLTPSLLDARYPRLPFDQPQLVVVDTEEEFSWQRPFSRQQRSVGAMQHVGRGHGLFESRGIIPTYVVDYPVAEQRAGFEPLLPSVAAGTALVGAHLHPWVTLPDEEGVDAYNSYACNLPPALERRKIGELRDRLHESFGAAPIIYKAGRYGFHGSTAESLLALGFTVDTSINPRLTSTPDGGPDFRAFDTRPFLCTGNAVSAAACAPVSLSDPSPPHRAAQRLRATLGFNAVPDVIVRAARQWCGEYGTSNTAVGGALVRAASLRQRLPSTLQVTPLPDTAGDAVGAAFAACLSHGVVPLLPESLQLGCAYDDHAVKQVLENCRLDFVYEPSWGRLMGRTSAALALGLKVAWFHGRAEVWTRALGGRGVLADPSLRHTRDNVHLYLLDRAATHALPVSVIESERQRALPGAPASVAGLGRWSGPSVPAWCVSAVEAGGWLEYQTVDAPTAPALHELLACHHLRTGVPGLVNVPVQWLQMGQHPRAAVVMMFSHAIDALVIGRFIVMKDMWLLRTSR